MNNIRNEMKTEGIFSRITEAKEWISDLEAEWKSLPWNRIKRKELKEMKTAQETSETMLNTPTFTLQEFQKETRERKGLRKY